MSGIDEGWSLEEEVEVVYTVWSGHQQEEQELVRKYSQMPQRAINCLADYTHKGKYNGRVVRAEPYVLDKAFVPFRISKMGIGRNTNEW